MSGSGVRRRRRVPQQDVLGGIQGDVAVVVRRALDRHQTIRLPDFLGFVFEAEHGEEQGFDRDVHVRLDSQAMAVRAECDPMLADRRPAAQGAKAQVTVGRGVGADGQERPNQWDHRCGRRQPQ